MTTQPITITSETFTTEVLNSAVPVLIDFWAPWCGPCRVMNPVIEAMAQDYEGRLKVAKVNVDEVPDLAGQYNVSAIPTLLILKEGEVVERISGIATQATLTKRLQDLGIEAAIAA